MAAAVDPVALKELLTSDNVTVLEETVRSYEDITILENPEEEEKLLKVRIMIWSRITALQKASGDSQIDSLQQIGNLWRTMGYSTKALGQLKLAEKLDAENAVTLGFMAEAYAEDSKYDLSVQYHEKCIGIWEKSADKKQDTAVAYRKLANTYWLKGDSQQSLEVLKKADGIVQDAGLGGTDTDAVILGQMGQLLERSGDYEEAVNVLTRAHKVLILTRGATNTKTEEIGFLLEMASNLKI
jgi:tetratricopeptide (TPR) repeat protein